MLNNQIAIHPTDIFLLGLGCYKLYFTFQNQIRATDFLASTILYLNPHLLRTYCTFCNKAAYNLFDEFKYSWITSSYIFWINLSPFLLSLVFQYIKYTPHSNLNGTANYIQPPGKYFKILKLMFIRDFFYFILKRKA